MCEANREATFAPLAALKLIVAQQVSCQKAGPGNAQQVASDTGQPRSFEQETCIDYSKGVGTAQYNYVSCLKSQAGAMGTHVAASKGLPFFFTLIDLPSLEHGCMVVTYFAAQLVHILGC